MCKSGCPLHLADNRIERTIGVLRGAKIAQAGMRLGSQAVEQSCRQSRLADAWLAGEQHHLSLARFGLRPPSQQQVEFFFPSNEVSQAACVHGLETAFNISRSQCRPGWCRP